MLFRKACLTATRQPYESFVNCSHQLCKENGVILLTFPPHCSHKLQPLDRSVCGPLKRYYNDACSRWMLNHLGRTISIHDVGGLLGDAYPCNITSGFRVAGIYSFNLDVFGENEFLPSAVTDRPDSNIGEPLNSPGSGRSSTSHPSAHMLTPNGPSTSEVRITTKQQPTPEEIRPFSKALPRKQNTYRKNPNPKYLQIHQSNCNLRKRS